VKRRGLDSIVNVYVSQCVDKKRERRHRGERGERGERGRRRA
jgi:hypothetical protein